MTAKNPRYGGTGATAGEARRALGVAAGQLLRQDRPGADRPTVAETLAAVRAEMASRPLGVEVPPRGLGRSWREGGRS